MRQLTNFTLSTVSIRKTIVLLSLFGGLLGPILSVKSASNVIVVSTTIQAALDAANPGDTILVPPGTYHESVRVTKDNITIVGSRGAIIDAGNRIGIRVGIGSRSVVNGIQVCPALALHNFILKGLTIRNARFAGVFLIGVDGYHLTGTKYVDNPIYGPFPVCSANGIIDFNSVEGGSSLSTNMGIDAGIYVGDSNTVTVRKNSVTNYAAGIEIENTSNAVVEENVLRGNSGGILVFVLPGLDKPFSDNVRIEHNEVIHNNVPNPVPFEPGPTGDPLGQLPTGTGILNVGADDVLITNNKVIGNDSLGVAIIQNPFGGLDPRIEPNPDRNKVRRNVILQNGRSPDPVRALSPGVDIAYDGTGVGTCFIDNIFRTEFPTGITSIFSCP
jgi:parallel beta-helix repeat-containing protein